jgi:DNA-binding transcriptional ArsR family regulator
MATKRGTGQGSDDRVVLDAQNLRGLAHPLRVRILGLLRDEGPSTATRLAEQLGESSGATSYHLRQLAAYGFVTEDPDHEPTGRERWWMSAHRSTTLGKEQVREAPIEAEGFMRAVLAEHVEKIEAYLAAFPTWPDMWDDGSTMSDMRLRLTAAESAQLRTDLWSLIDRYRRDAPGVEAPPDAERVILQIQLMPQLPPTIRDRNEETER